MATCIAPPSRAVDPGSDQSVSQRLAKDFPADRRFPVWFRKHVRHAEYFRVAEMFDCGVEDIAL